MPVRLFFFFFQSQSLCVVCVCDFYTLFLAPCMSVDFVVCWLKCLHSWVSSRKQEKIVEIRESAKSSLKSCEQYDVQVRQDIKNSKSQRNKMAKNFEKERDKLKEYEAAPDKCNKEIEEGKAKMKVLEVQILYTCCLFGLLSLLSL